MPDQDDSDAVLSLSGCVSGGGTGGTTSGTTGTTGTTGGTTGTSSGGVSAGTTGGTTGGSPGAQPAAGALPFTGLPVWIPLLAAFGLVAGGFLVLRRRAQTGE